MPNYKVEIDFQLEKICYFGSKVNCRNGLYLHVEIFNKIKFSANYPARFPVNLCEHLCFREIYFDCPSSMTVLDKLNDAPVTIELIETDCTCEDSSIAYFDTNALDLTGLQDSGPNRCYNRTINMINKDYKCYDSPTLYYSLTASITKMNGCEIPRCSPNPCSLRSKRRDCCPPISVRRCSPRSPIRNYDCSRRNRSVSPLLCPPRRNCSSVRRSCTPSLICPPKCPPDVGSSHNWNVEISRLTRNLREVSDQIRQLTNMQRYRTELCSFKRNCDTYPPIPRFSRSMPCRRSNRC